VAGKHQDIIIYRSALNQTRVIPTKGTWLGIADDIHGYLNNQAIPLEKGDIILLYTDGATEATSITGEMYGQHRLERSLSQYADLPISRIRDKIIEDVTRFQDVQQDDLTLVVIQKK
jgi:serine phosphatase RsbU (regulator of sigma subunit)